MVCATAQDMVQRLAHYLGFATNIRFANFTPYNLAVTTDITYADLISPIRAGVPEIVVDFTERIRFNGNEYFLVSNNISFTPRKLIQKLQLVRWY